MKASTNQTMSIEAMLNELGFANALLLRESYQTDSFGDGEIIFRVGHVLLRFLKDRGQVMLDIGTSEAKDSFYISDDIFVFLGLETIDEVLERTNLRNLEKDLSTIHGHFRQLERAFSTGMISETKNRLDAIKEDREKAAMRRWSAIAEEKRRQK